MAATDERTDGPDRGRVVDPAKLLAALATGLTLAGYRLYVGDGLLAGPPLAGLALVGLVLTAAVLAVAIAVDVGLRAWWRARLAPAAARSPGPLARLVLDAAPLGLSAALFGALGTLGIENRIPLAVALGLIAVTTQRLARRGRGARWRDGLVAIVALAALASPLAGEPSFDVVGDRLAGLDLDGPGHASRPSIVLFGVDGMDWDLATDLMAEGRMPHLSALAETGFVRPLRTFKPTSSPFIWHAIYSGYTPAAHRLRPPAVNPAGDLVVAAPRGSLPDLPGLALRLAGATSVRYPLSFWDLLGRSGYRTAVVGSWDLAPVPRSGLLWAHHRVELRPWDDPDRRVDLSPGAQLWLAPGVREAARHLERSARDLEDEWRMLLGPDFPLERLWAASDDEDAPGAERRLARVRVALPSDTVRFELLRLAVDTLEAGDRPYVAVGYARGLDLVQHGYLHLVDGDPLDADDDALAGIVERYYARVDRWIGDLVERVGRETVVLVASDHGFDVVDLDFSPLATGYHTYAPDGVLASSARRPGRAVPASPHVLDVAPTMLALGGLPVPAGLEGRVIEAVTPRTTSIEDWRTLAPGRYARGDPALRDPLVDRELRALGYVESGEDDGSGAGVADELRALGYRDAAGEPAPP